MTEPLVTCRACHGEGIIHGPVRAVGVSWATPCGIPDWDDYPCETCGGAGKVEWGQYYEDLAEMADGEVLDARGVRCQ